MFAGMTVGGGGGRQSGRARQRASRPDPEMQAAKLGSLEQAQIDEATRRSLEEHKGRSSSSSSSGGWQRNLFGGHNLGSARFKGGGSSSSSSSSSSAAGNNDLADALRSVFGGANANAPATPPPSSSGRGGSRRPGDAKTKAKARHHLQQQHLLTNITKIEARTKDLDKKVMDMIQSPEHKVQHLAEYQQPVDKAFKPTCYLLVDVNEGVAYQYMLRNSEECQVLRVVAEVQPLLAQNRVSFIYFYHRKVVPRSGKTEVAVPRQPIQQDTDPMLINYLKGSVISLFAERVRGPYAGLKPMPLILTEHGVEGADFLPEYNNFTELTARPKLLMGPRVTQSRMRTPLHHIWYTKRLTAYGRPLAVHGLLLPTPHLPENLEDLLSWNGDTVGDPDHLHSAQDTEELSDSPALTNSVGLRAFRHTASERYQALQARLSSLKKHKSQAEASVLDRKPSSVAGTSVISGVSRVSDLTEMMVQANLLSFNERTKRLEYTSTELRQTSVRNRIFMIKRFLNIMREQAHRLGAAASAAVCLTHLLFKDLTDEQRGLLNDPFSCANALFMADGYVNGHKLSNQRLTQEAATLVERFNNTRSLWRLMQPTFSDSGVLPGYLATAVDQWKLLMVSVKADRAGARRLREGLAEVSGAEANKRVRRLFNLLDRQVGTLKIPDLLQLGALPDENQDADNRSIFLQAAKLSLLCGLETVRVLDASTSWLTSICRHPANPTSFTQDDVRRNSLVMYAVFLYFTRARMLMQPSASQPRKLHVFVAYHTQKSTLHLAVEDILEGLGATNFNEQVLVLGSITMSDEGRFMKDIFGESLVQRDLRKVSEHTSTGPLRPIQFQRLIKRAYDKDIAYLAKLRTRSIPGLLGGGGGGDYSTPPLSPIAENEEEDEAVDVSLGESVDGVADSVATQQSLLADPDEDSDADAAAAEETAQSPPWLDEQAGDAVNTSLLNGADDSEVFFTPQATPAKASSGSANQKDVDWEEKPPRHNTKVSDLFYNANQGSTLNPTNLSINELVENGLIQFKKDGTVNRAYRVVKRGLLTPRQTPRTGGGTPTEPERSSLLRGAMPIPSEVTPTRTRSSTRQP